MTGFVSLRWRVLLPVVALMLFAAALTYAFIMGADVRASQTAQREYAIIMALIVGVVVASVLLLINRSAARLHHITRTVRALRAGHRPARTHAQPTDEIGKLGAEIDRYAAYTQDRQDELRAALRQKRQELAQMTAILESLPEGVIVQDLDGRVILMNDHARALLGSARVFRSAKLHELTAIVTDQLGVLLAPGLYTLGDPKRLELDGKMLSAQAAAILSSAEQRLGTVILLRDLSDHVRREQNRDAMVDRLAAEIHEPLTQLARRSLADGGQSPEFARELTRHAFALQKLIVELRDVGDVDDTMIQQVQRPLPLETLIWAIVNEWRQIAQSHRLELRVSIGVKGLFVLGDERRLRWAIGNLVENAIHYTPMGGVISLEIHGEENHHAQIRLRDNGVGILPEDAKHLFTRFWRGTPTTADGRVLRVPGMGQGLYIAKQIIEAHGGNIRIKSKPHVGTAVYFMLPLTSGEGGYTLPTFQDADIDGETVLLQAQPPVE